MTRSKALILALLVLACVYAYTATQHTSTQSQPHQIVSSSDQSLAGHTVYGAPSISAQQIDAILCAAQSPACHTGEALFSYGKQAGIDPAYALAFFEHESSYGKAGVARLTKGLGNIRCTDGYKCIDGFRAYQSWQAGYKDWYALISWYASALKKRTVEAIVPTYAPSVENDTQGYIRAVLDAVASYHHA